MMDKNDSREDHRRPDDHGALQEHRERARAAERKVRRELYYNGHVSDETKVKAVDVALDYRNVLIDYKYDLGPDRWESRDVDWPLQLVGHQVEREQQRPGRDRGTTTDELPAAAEVNGHKIHTLLKHLDQIWRALGFGARVEDDDRDVFAVDQEAES